MATDSSKKCIAYTAGADLSAKQFTFLALSGDNTVDAAAANGADAVGVLQNDPVLGQSAAVCVDGQTKVVFGATLAAGVEVTNNADGAAIEAVAGNTVLAVVAEGAANGAIGSVLLVNKGVKA